MKYTLAITARAKKDILSLPKNEAVRITKKLRFFISSPLPLSYAKPLTNTEVAEYRFRVGDYRILFDIDKQGNITILTILTVKHRKDVYKGL